MSGDLVDWQQASEADKKLIGGLLRAFTLSETFIGCYWSDKVTKLFPRHESVMMAKLFSYQETIHTVAYNHLSDSLGIDEWEAFQGDSTAQDKLNFLMEDCDPVVSLGIFSGCMEGMSLMGSFVLLLSFCQQGRFRGLNQILSWSNLDESLHHEAGCKLFRELDKEGKVTPEHKEKIKTGFDLALRNEEAFLQNAYQGHPNPPIQLLDILQYLKYRSNKALKNLGINYRYSYYPSVVEPIIELYETQINGTVSVDFFSQSKNGAGYVAKPPQFNQQIDWTKL